MSDLEKRWDTKLPLSVSMHVLRRSVETAALLTSEAIPNVAMQPTIADIDAVPQHFSGANGG